MMTEEFRQGPWVVEVEAAEPLVMLLTDILADEDEREQARGDGEDGPHTHRQPITVCQSGGGAAVGAGLGCCHG
jgi:hypothetical protein